MKNLKEIWREVAPLVSLVAIAAITYTVAIALKNLCTYYFK